MDVRDSGRWWPRVGGSSEGVDSSDGPTVTVHEQEPFRGGALTLYSDRVELCGVNICYGPRCESKRAVLELLCCRRKDGAFVQYSGVELEAEAKKRGANGTASRWISDLRDDIIERLRAQKSIICGKMDVILSGGPGYRLSDHVTVQFVDPPSIIDFTDISAQGVASHVLNEGVLDVADVRDADASDRRRWILSELSAGRRLKASEIAGYFECSLKTAQRDLAYLKNEGRILFVGYNRTGYYRLTHSR